MRLAVIDCGTNTFNLVIVEGTSATDYRPVYKTRVPVKLGESAINQGYILEAAFTRGLHALHEFQQLIQAQGVKEVLAFATSAIRDASNGALFVREAAERFGLHIQVIDGQREAELIYLGVRAAVQMDSNTALIVDIGGGSTEFILASAQGMLWKESFRLGAARLLEKFKPSDPIMPEEITAMNDYLRVELQPLFEAVAAHPPRELIGSSGAFDSLVEMIHGERGGEPLTDSKTDYLVASDDYHAISDLVKRSSLLERRQIRGLVPMRVDMIVISCVIVDFVLQQTGLERLRVSTFSLKEGALVEVLSKNAKKI